MNALERSFVEDYTADKSGQNIEMDNIKTKVPIPASPQAPEDKEFQATQITPEQVFISLLEKFHEHPELRDQLLNKIDPNDPIYDIAHELLNKDLESSTHLIHNKDWIQIKDEEYQAKVENKWLVKGKPKSTFQYYHLVTKPAQALWWTGKSIYKVACVVTPILSPVITVVSIVQSPWAQILMVLIRRSIK
jgi:hypothetical protein